MASALLLAACLAVMAATPLGAQPSGQRPRPPAAAPSQPEPAKTQSQPTPEASRPGPGQEQAQAQTPPEPARPAPRAFDGPPPVTGPGEPPVTTVEPPSPPPPEEGSPSLSSGRPPMRAPVGQPPPPPPEQTQTRPPPPPPDDPPAQREPPPRTPVEPTPAAPPPAASAPSFPWLLFSIAAVIIALLGAALAWSLRRHRELDVAYRDAEKLVADQLNVPIGELPQAMERVYSRLEELDNENDSLRRQLQAGGGASGAVGTGALLVSLMTEAVDKSRDALNAAKDPEVAGLDQVLGIGKSLSLLASALRASDGPDPDARIASLLERGHLDGALTIAPFLDSYARERGGLTALRRELGRLETLARAALRHADIEVTVPAPLTQLDELPEGSVGDDRRGVRRIALVRERALSAARRLAPGRFMVVDCHTPGFQSTRIGRRAPGLAMFDPAAWT